jgi:hypothetical protein
MKCEGTVLEAELLALEIARIMVLYARSVGRRTFVSQPAGIPPRALARPALVLLGAAFVLLVLAIWIVLEFHAQAAHALGPEAPAPASMKAGTAAVGTAVEGATTPLKQTVAPRANAPVKRTVGSVVSLVRDAAFALADDATVIHATSRSTQPSIAHERASRSATAEAGRARAAARAAPTSARSPEPRQVPARPGPPSAPDSSDLLAFPLSTSHGRWSPIGEHGSDSVVVFPACNLPVPSAGRRLGRFGAGRPVVQFAFFDERPG